MLRAQKKVARSGASGASYECDAVRAYAYEAADRMESDARRALARIAEGDTLRTHLALLKRFLRRTPPDVIELRRRLANRALELNRYPFS